MSEVPLYRQLELVTPPGNLQLCAASIAPQTDRGRQPLHYILLSVYDQTDVLLTGVAWLGLLITDDRLLNLLERFPRYCLTHATSRTMIGPCYTPLSLVLREVPRRYARMGSKRLGWVAAVVV